MPKLAALLSRCRRVRAIRCHRSQSWCHGPDREEAAQHLPYGHSHDLIPQEWLAGDDGQSDQAGAECECRQSLDRLPFQLLDQPFQRLLSLDHERSQIMLLGSGQARPRIFATHQRSPTNRKRQSRKNSGDFPSKA